MARDGLPVQLGEIQETLLISVYLRALETKRADGIIRDHKAVEIVRSVDYDFGKFDNAWYLQIGIAVATEIIDEAVKNFLAHHRKATVVNLGAGLDGRFMRMDDGRVRWFDLDLPDAMELRRQFYQESERNRFLAGSLFDDSWIDEIGPCNGRDVLLIAEGVFEYFAENDVRKFLSRVATRLAGAELLFESISPTYVGQERLVPAVNQTRAKLRWGIHSGRELESWDPRYEFLDEWSCIDRHPSRWGLLFYLCQMPWWHDLASEAMKITRLRLRGRDPPCIADRGGTESQSEPGVFTVV
jgi:O-methyltransferase involved in polyketide biosynthesis